MARDRLHARRYANPAPDLTDAQRMNPFRKSLDTELPDWYCFLVILLRGLNIVMLWCAVFFTFLLALPA
jgi:hypothetical protein